MLNLVSEYPDFDLESLLNQPAFLQFGHNGEGIHGHWNAAKPWNNSALDIVFINRPAENYERGVHPNE